MSFLAIIPARSGSKGLRDKNICPLYGKPLIHYTIEAALKTGLFSDVLVSTDSPAYREIAEAAGAVVPFLREKSLASDTAKTGDVIADILQKCDCTAFALLQPTSPLRNERHILEAAEIFTQKDANAVVSVSEAEHSPLWCNTLGADLRMDQFLNRGGAAPRQQLETYYRLNGAIYLAKTDYFLAHRDFYHDHCYAYIMDKYSSVDIDDEFDFTFAEFLLQQ